MNKTIFLLVSFLVFLDANIIPISPLTAILKDKNIKEAIVTINSKDTKEIPLIYKITEKNIKEYGGVPIFGLYEDFNNKIDIEYKINNEIKKDTYYLQTKALENKKNEIKQTKIDNTRFDNRFYFVIDEDSAFIIDTLGNVRWFANIDKTQFIEKPKMFILNNMAFDIINGKAFMLNIQDSAKLLNINDNIFKINNNDIELLDRDYKILNKWKFPFEVDVLNNISSLYYSNDLFVAYRDSIIKLDKKSKIEWIFGGNKDEFKLVDATGSKILCQNCNNGKIENMQEIRFLNNKYIIYIIIFDNNINAKALIYKIDERLKTKEILWTYEIKDEVLQGNAIYKENSHTIFMDYKDIDKNLHILEFAWGEKIPTINIKIENALKAIPFDINNFFR